MAFASDVAWEGFPARKSPSFSNKRHWALASILAAGVAALVFAFIGAPAVRLAPEFFNSSLFQNEAPVAAEKAHASVVAQPAPKSSFEKNVESFLRDSLPLTRDCGGDCAPVRSVIAEAEKFGRLSLRANAPLPSGLPLQPSFAAAIANLPPAVAVTQPPATPRLLVHSSVVVPLPPVIPAPDPAPVPAPRLARSVAGVPALEASIEPVEKPAIVPPGLLSIGKPGFVRNDGVAIYDISAAVVYMPNGERLEAHSGLGSMVDDPRYVDRPDIGPTPPNTYDLIMRKGRFHGVDAVRLIPANGNNKYGRVGLLAHPYMLRGRPGQSNGCVVFKDYGRFLRAFQSGQVRQMVVVASLPARRTASATAIAG